MTVMSLLAHLDEKKVALSVDGEELVVRGERQNLDKATLIRLRECKQDLIALIKSGQYLSPAGGEDEVFVPPNRIPPGCTSITPEMLPLVTLTREDIDRVVAAVPAGAANIQDIYPLAPLQEGILFHHLLTEGGDPYLLSLLIRFDDRARLDAYLAAFQAVTDRHDILRTAIVWQGMTEPVQVVWRRAAIAVETCSFDPQAGPVAEQLRAAFDPRRKRIDISSGPMVRLLIAQDEADGRWLALMLLHHLIGDHTTLDGLQAEIRAHLRGREDRLPPPLPFRNFVAQARSGAGVREHEAFFMKLLAGVDEPTAPFGLDQAREDGSAISEASHLLATDLTLRLRGHARRLGLSSAAVFHLAWALVLARAAARDDVVFGTVMFGRMQGGAGAERVLGPFLNTLPFRLRIGEQSVEAGLRQTQILLADLLRHEHASLALAQRCSAIPAPAPLFSALLNYRHTVAELANHLKTGSSGWEGIEHGYGNERTNYPLTLSVDDWGDELEITIQVADSVDARRVARLMRDALVRLVEALDQGSHRSLQQLDPLPQEERRQLLDEWNATTTAYPRESALHTLFAAQVRLKPGEPAVIEPERSLSYGELDVRANGLAGFLAARGVRPGERVAILLERSIELIVAQLAILKCGAAYVPLDPGQPRERLAFMVADCAARILITDHPERDAGLAECVSPAMATGSLPAPYPAAADRGEMAAYLMYTSGSTGRPKGVIVPHRAVSRLVLNNGFAPFRAGDRVAFAANPAFDASTLEVWAPLLNGGAAVVVPEDFLLDVARFRKILEEQAVDVLWLTVGLFNQYAEGLGDVLTRLRYLIVGGDALDPATIARVMQRNPPKHLLNGYGPTETTTFATTFRVVAAAEGASHVPIGRPIANARLYVLDRRGRLLPIGAAGELHIGGAGLAHGYLGRPGLTAERFVPDPFAGESGARAYKSGDLVRYLPDGNLVFLGRTDHQVKIRGFRIEPGEIENRLRAHPAIADAVVLPRDTTTGERRLIAYYTTPAEASPAAAGSAGEPPSTEALLRFLGASLPDYMLPAAFVHLDRLPLTANGKIDRRALPEPGDTAFALRDYEAPRTAIEEAVALIWAPLLGLERVGRKDHFFELGGHSLLVVRMVSRLRRDLKIEVPLGVLYAQPVLADFAAALAGAAEDALPPIVPVSPEQRLVLSFAQQRLWFLAQFEQASAAYHIRLGLRLVGSLDRDALSRSLDRLVWRHESLRTTFNARNGEPLAAIATSANSSFHLVEHDLRGQADQAESLRCLLIEEAEQPFDLARGPLIRGRLIRQDEEDHTLLISQHHIISDGWSIGILMRELSLLYAAYRDGAEDPMPPLPLQFGDYAAWQRRWLTGEILQRQANYWRTTFAGASFLLPLPLDRERPAEQDYSGASLGLTLDEALTSGIECLSRQHGTTVFMTLLAAWAALLSRLSGQDHVIVGTPSANRSRNEIEGLVGLFVNTLALRIDLDDAPTGAALLARTRQQTLAAQQHQDIPFEQVVEVVNPPRSMAYSPLFQVMVTWEPEQQHLQTLPGLTLSAPASVPNRSAQFDLTLGLRAAGRTIEGELEFATALFERETLIRHLDHWRNLLTELIADPGRRVDALPVLGPADRQLILYAWNETRQAFPAASGIHRLVEDQVAATPDATALVCEDRRLSYRELNGRANRLAHHLRAMGAGPGDRIAICLDRNPDVIMAILATLKAGAAYVPLDPAYPAQRLNYMLADCSPVALLTNRGLNPSWTEVLAGLPETLPVLDLTADVQSWSGHPDQDPSPAGLSSADLAYVIYTSGSTGQPKGVMVTHRNLTNQVADMVKRYALSAADRVLQFDSYSFDASVEEIFIALTTGATLVLRTDAWLTGAETFWRLCEAANISVMDLPTRFWQILADETTVPIPACVRLISIGGEAVEKATFDTWFQGVGYRPKLINCYGPTEATIAVLLYVTERENAHWRGIGRPIANVRIYLLDGIGQPVPIGVAGEIHIGGEAVTRGYLERPALTAGSFLPDPYGTDPGARMYKTGDLARYRSDGLIEFLGRNDRQVKIRGFRIELGEIETRLREHPEVGEAVVVQHGREPGEPYLAAYVVGPEASPRANENQEAQGPLALRLRRFLGRTLPDHMIPAAFVRLDRLPLTPNGKLDRKALPEPAEGAQSLRAYEPPRGELEATVAGVWAALLKLARIGRRDHFFELGGHSLLAVQVISRLRRQLGIEPQLRDLFLRPVLMDFAQGLATASPSDLPPILPAEPAEREALSFAQQRLWFLAQLEKGSSLYHIPLCLRLQGHLDSGALRAAFDRLIERHESLRTLFRVVDGKPRQYFVPPGESSFLLRECDLVDRPDAATRLACLVREDQAAPIDLEKGPLIRGLLIRLSAREHVLSLTLHHIVSDGWSMGIIVNELGALYAARLAGEADRLPPLPLQYADFAAWQRRWISGQVLQGQIDYWKTALAGAPVLLDLPTDRPRPAEQDHRGEAVDLLLTRELTAEIRALSHRQGTTLYMTLLAAWGLLLSRLSGQEEVVIGSSHAGRNHADVEGLVGFFINTFAIRLRPAGDLTVTSLLQQVLTRALAAQRNGDIPLDQVVEVAGPPRTLAHHPLFQSVFAWDSFDEGELALPGLELAPFDEPMTVLSKVDISLNLHDGGAHIAGGLVFATALFDRATIERYLAHWHTLLEAMVQGDDRKVADLPLLQSAERRRILTEWNATAADFPGQRCMHEPFEDQAAGTPRALAVAGSGKEWEYEELNLRANRLAHHLVNLGIGPGDRVALHMPRCPELLAGILAILKAGAAYVPLATSGPEERLAYLLRDCAPAVVLCLNQEAAANHAALRQWPCLFLAAPNPPWGNLSNDNPRIAGLTSNELAYLIYTSGSTGRPKGVMVTHRSVVNLLQWYRRETELAPPDRVLVVSAFSFDLTQRVAFGPLLAGAGLILAGEPFDAKAIVSLVARHGVTLMNLTPSAFHSLIEAATAGELSGLQRVFLGGEQSQPARLSALHEPRPRFVNNYGPTEGTATATCHRLATDLAVYRQRPVPLGKPIPNARVYLLDRRGEPVPIGVTGELHIAGEGVARGYWRRPELTADKFIPDPYSATAGARMYRTGDLARYREDGDIEFRGRNDFQVKIRGFRVELGEIEVRLASHPAVADAVVLARTDGAGGLRLVGYYVLDANAPARPEVEDLRRFLGEELPDYLLPAAFVALDHLPLTANGKLDRSALPDPGDGAYATRAFAAPLGALENRLAGIWADLLKLEKVGRHDNFFALGGHSLLAVTMMARLREAGIHADVRAVFIYDTLASLAAAVAAETAEIAVPPNVIPTPCASITPAMLPLVDLTAEEIDLIANSVMGGVANIQDIYPLAPLQEGILFHHLLAREADPYLSRTLTAFVNRGRLDAYLAAMQAVVDRHDIMRTAILWTGLPEPVQVVWRRATLSVETLALDPACTDAAAYLLDPDGPGRARLDLNRAPLVRIFICQDPTGDRWLMLMLSHHLACDHTTLEAMHGEIQAHLLGQSENLPEPLPFRNLVAQTRQPGRKAHDEAFFRSLLADVTEPTIPFDLARVRGDGCAIDEGQSLLDGDLATRLRTQAQRLAVSPASICHVAWALVLARVSGRTDVVFGTVLLGRMHGATGAERVLGLFMNTLPLRIRLAAAAETVRQTHFGLADLLRHEHASLAMAQRCSGVPPEQPLFSALFNYRHIGGGDASAQAADAWDGIEPLFVEERTNYPLTLSVNDFGVDIGFSVLVDASIDANRVCRLMETALASLVLALDRNPDTPLTQLEVLPLEERRLVLETWNETAATFPAGRFVHELFERQAAATPAVPALFFRDSLMDYARLNAEANQLAHHLRGLGVVPDARVALYLERGFDMVIAVLAVLKAGGAYVPLDPAYPPDRLGYMLQDSAPVAVLTSGDPTGHGKSLLRQLPASIAVVPIDAATPVWRDEPATAIDPAGLGLAPANLAYVIYTSGSTGRPKGVMVTHGGLTNYLAWALDRYRPLQGSVFSTSLAFDAAVTSLYLPLLCGSAVRLLPQGEEIEGLEALLTRPGGIGLLKITPSHLDTMGQRLMTGHSAEVDAIVIGGENLTCGTGAMWRRLQPRARLINEYGPTETVVGCIVFELPAEVADTGNVPIGKPIANTRIYILDEGLRPVPIGAVGELLIAGAGLARGYRQRPDLTAERFIPDPFAAEPGARAYRSGDLARWRSDGDIEFLGRRDAQLKIRGYRIEPGEIENCLVAHEGIRAAIVRPWLSDERDTRLVAYVLPEPAGHPDQVTPTALRRHLGRSLPEFMIPAAFVTLEELPLTPNGKLDHRALPTPDGSAFAKRGYVAPLGEVETILAELWSDLLGLDRVGRHDNFFELGGHSLLAVRLMERMRRKGLHADVGSVFTSPTLARLAEALGRQAIPVVVPPNLIPKACERITPGMLPLVDLTRREIDRIVAAVPGGAPNIQDIYPLAPLQEGILFHHLLGGKGDPYLQLSIAAFPDRPRLEAYLAALQAVADRHDILRTALVYEGLSQPLQVVLRSAPLPVEEITLESGNDDAVAVLQERFDPRRYRIDVGQAPMMRLKIARDGAGGRYLLAMLFHHLIGDHSTLAVMNGEIQAHLLGQAHCLSAALPFRNFVAQARLGVSEQEHEAFFKDMLGDVSEPTVPFGLADVRSEQAAMDIVRVSLDPGLSDRLRERARHLGVSAASLFHLAWARVLAQISGRRDVVFGTVLFGRMQGGEGADRVMGLFINTLPLRLRVNGEAVAAGVQRTHVLLADLLRHEHASLALAQRCSGVLPPAPLFSSLLNYRHSGDDKTPSAQADQAWEGIENLYGEERTNYPLTLSVDDRGRDFGLKARVLSAIGGLRICRFMTTLVGQLVTALESAPDTPLKNLDALPAEERSRLLREWNATASAIPCPFCPHELFERQAAATPDALALVFHDRVLSYAELNAGANRLAHHLIHMGIRPEHRVAVLAGRHPDMVIAMLAVFKAGGVYLPLDPGYPAERLAYMIADSAPVAFIARAGLGAVWQAMATALPAGLPILEISDAAPAWQDRSPLNPGRDASGLTPAHLAYVIYTSGSTGRPKGVLVEHHRLAATLLATRAEIDLKPDDRWPNLHSPAFDISLLEILLPLICGSSSQLLTEDEILDADRLVATTRDVTMFHTIPSLLSVWHAALRDGDTCYPNLRYIWAGGEAASPRLLTQLSETFPNAALSISYGPTEVSILSTLHAYRADPVCPAPHYLGRPLQDTPAYVLDDALNLQPIGVPGVLYLGGIRVARGYHNRPDLTAQRFVPDPYCSDPAARMYQTGDLVRMLADGNLEFIGRDDHQVKIRGFRIELGEIEMHLTEHPAVREAAVCLQVQATGEKSLVAYCVPVPGLDEATGEARPPLSPAALRAFLGAKLPAYMVPAAFVQLEDMPRSPNGKLDRRALPAAEHQACHESDYEAPRGEIETALASIWAGLLNRDSDTIGRQDDFFNLGGHSLLATRLVLAMKNELEVAISLRDVFEAPILCRLAERVLDAQLAQFDQEALAEILDSLRQNDGTAAKP